MAQSSLIFYLVGIIGLTGRVRIEISLVMKCFAYRKQKWFICTKGPAETKMVHPTMIHSI
jgi:hypothetical protein